MGVLKLGNKQHSQGKQFYKPFDRDISVSLKTVVYVSKSQMGLSRSVLLLHLFPSVSRVEKPGSLIVSSTNFFSLSSSLTSFPCKLPTFSPSSSSLENFGYQFSSGYSFANSSFMPPAAKKGLVVVALYAWILSPLLLQLSSFSSSLQQQQQPA